MKKRKNKSHNELLNHCRSKPQTRLFKDDTVFIQCPDCGVALKLPSKEANLRWNQGCLNNQTNLR